MDVVWQRFATDVQLQKIPVELETLHWGRDMKPAPRRRLPENQHAPALTPPSLWWLPVT